MPQSAGPLRDVPMAPRAWRRQHPRLRPGAGGAAARHVRRAWSRR